MKSPSFTNVLRPSLLGDIIVSLPFLNYLHRCYPNSFKCAYIDKKCYQIIPFLINHPLIDKIQISDESDRISQKDLEFFKQFDVSFNPFSNHLIEDYYNYNHFIKETFCMNEVFRTKERINPEEFDKLSEEERKPKLHQWFDIERQNKTIAIWPFSGYSNDKNSSIRLNLRSPSKEWWMELIQMLPDYKIIQLGHPKSERLDNPNVVDARNLDLFSAAKLSMGCDVSITTDSGISWILGAYGSNQIVLYSNYMPNHHSNKDCYLTTNVKNNLISLFGENGIQNINQKIVVDSIKKFI